MGACPFCKGEVEADVLTFGGRCPSCLIEIPGEEAPTDPGAEARAAREAEEAAAAAKKAAGPLIMGGLVALLAVFGGAYAAFGPGEEPLPDIPTGSEAYKKVSSQFIKFDLDEEPEEEPVAEEPKKTGTTAKKTTSGGKKSTGGSKSSGTKSSVVGSNLPDTPTLDSPDIEDIPLTDAGSARSEVGGAPEATRTDGGVPEAVGSVMDSNRAKPTGLLADIGGGPRDRIQGEEYCGEEMREPVKMIMKQLGQRLRSCGDRMLKKDEKFSSSVKVSIAVQESGRIAAIDLQPSNSDDPEFLGCIEKTIKKTSFPRFCTGLDLAKTYYFGSQR